MNIVISGPGGVGKGTLVARLIAADDRLWLSRSWTTRPRRDGEPADAYHFVDRDTFDAHIDAGGFLEWVDFLDYRQGTPVPDPPDGADAVFEIDVQGARAIRAVDAAPVLVFVDAPSPADQAERLRGRGDSPERIEARLRKAVEEREVARELGMFWIVNDDLDQALTELTGHIEACRTA